MMLLKYGSLLQSYQASELKFGKIHDFRVKTLSFYPTRPIQLAWLPDPRFCFGRIAVQGEKLRLSWDWFIYSC